VGACRAETPNFVFWQEQLVRTKFGGNKLDVSPQGRSHIHFKKSGDHISWNGVSTAVHNIIIGGMWIDHFGKTVIENHTTKETVRLHMHQCGWFGKNRYHCDATVLNANKKPTGFKLAGNWNDELRSADGSVLW
jgi:oxysterol-binding protein-related protein 3/6/7